MTMFNRTRSFSVRLTAVSEVWDARRGAKRFRALSGRMAIDEEKRNSAKQARMEALETGVDADAFFVEEDAEESDIETELDVDDSGRGVGRKKKGGGKRFGKGVYGVPAATSFMVLLEESGVYEDKVPVPHYLSAEAVMENSTCRNFCVVCGNMSSYRCPRCREPFCSMKCQTAHKEVQCVQMAL